MAVTPSRLQSYSAFDTPVGVSSLNLGISFVRLGIAQADSQASLRVSVDQQDILSGLRQTDSKIGTGGGFTNAALLVGDGDDLRVH